jgi:hypothetical protein
MLSRANKTLPKGHCVRVHAMGFGGRPQPRTHVVVLSDGDGGPPYAWRRRTREVARAR